MFEGMKGLWAKSHKSDPKGQQQQKVPWVLEKTHLDTVVNVTVMFKVVDTLEVLAECLAASPASFILMPFPIKNCLRNFSNFSFDKCVHFG